ncbi:MAG TPA: PDZ domain-containing protein [Vicinamibacterales bacterium]|jgi:S1-C subfamily serine protease
MKQWSSRPLTVVIASTSLVGTLAVLAAPVAAQYSARMLREPADVMFLAGRGAMLGLTVRDVDNPEKQAGVVVEDVVPGGAADKAGFKRGDVITAFEGEAVRSARQFTRLVDEAAPGHAVRMSYVRDGRRNDVTMTPAQAERPATVYIDPEQIRERLREAMPAVDTAIDMPGTRARLGVTIQEMTPQLATYFGAKEGMLVSSVSDDSPASRAGLKAGDVIVSVDGRKVATRTDLVSVLREAKDRQEVSIGIMRERRASSVKATLERPERLYSNRSL